MRVGVVLPTAPDGALEPVLAEARLAEDLGLDLVWISEGPQLRAATPVAAAIAAQTSFVRVVVECDLGEHHPMQLAEEVAVADLCLGGRLVVAVRPAGGHESRFDEALDLFLAAIGPRPFRHEGPTWHVPANLAGHRPDTDRRVRVTPAPAQLALPVWVVGTAHADEALRRGMPFVAGGGEDPTGAWRDAEARFADALRPLRRPALRALADDTVEALRGERDTWGLDVAALSLDQPAGSSARRDGLERIAGHVRPRVQLESIPPLLATLEVNP